MKVYQPTTDQQVNQIVQILSQFAVTYKNQAYNLHIINNKNNTLMLILCDLMMMMMMMIVLVLVIMIMIMMEITFELHQ